MRLLTSLSIVFLLLFSVNKSLEAATSSEAFCHPDFADLISFYNATGGATWTNNTGWVDGAAGTDCMPCNWHGVTCDGSGRVQALLLSDNQLSGTLPASIGNFTNMVVLALDNNQLTGSIPVELGNLSTAAIIYLNDNQFSGCFPYYLTNLCGVSTNVDMSNNVGLPGNGDFASFCATNAGGCYVPISFCHPDYDALMALYAATDGANWLNNTGWADGMAGFDCDVCNWYGVYCSLGRVIALDLQSNQLNGSLPPEIGDLTYLSNILFTDNQINGAIPIELNQLSYIALISLAANQLSGTIPVELGNLSTLTYLSLDGNQLTGTIPVEFGDLLDLIYLGLSDNDLSGCIPIELGSLSDLQFLRLSDNQLSCAIPSELGALSSLEGLYLQNNLLTDCIPPELGNLPNLMEFFANDNQLACCFPSNLQNLCPIITDFSNNPGLPGGGDFASFCASDAGECDIALDLNVLLKGPYDTGSSLMKDDLRQMNLIPLSFGGSTISDPNLLTVTGNDAIVDWITIELRPMGAASTILLQQAALIQRDGDVVDAQGNSPIYLGGSLPTGSYHVAIRHRNHLGVMNTTAVIVN